MAEAIGLRVLLALVFAVVLAGCGSAKKNQQGGMQAMPVATVALQPTQVADSATYVSTLKSRNSTTIDPQVEGQITKIFVHSGERVKAGAALMQIDPLKQQATTESQDAALKAKQADLVYAKQQLDRTRQLYQDGVTSKEEMDSALNAYDADVAQVNSLRAQSQEQIVQLRYFQVTAPTAGIVGDIPVHVGDRVTTTTMLTTVDQAGGLEAYVQVPVEKAPELAMGKTVQILADDGSQLGEGKITFVSPEVDPQTQTILVKALIPNSKGILRTEETVRARVIFGEHPGLLIPVLAVSQINGQAFVFVAEQGPKGFVSRQRQIQLGDIQGNDYVVESGLKPGDQLITSGLAILADGMPIAPMGKPNAG